MYCSRCFFRKTTLGGLEIDFRSSDPVGGLQTRRLRCCVEDRWGRAGWWQQENWALPASVSSFLVPLAQSYLSLGSISLTWSPASILDRFIESSLYPSSSKVQKEGWLTSLSAKAAHLPKRCTHALLWTTYDFLILNSVLPLWHEPLHCYLSTQKHVATA